MVGLIAGMANFASACLRAETCISVQRKFVSIPESAGLHVYLRLERIRATEEAIVNKGEVGVVEVRDTRTQIFGERTVANLLLALAS